MELLNFSRKIVEPLCDLKEEQMSNHAILLNVISTIRIHLDLAESNIVKHKINSKVIGHYASILHPIAVNVPSLFHHDIDNNYVLNDSRL